MARTTDTDAVVAAMDELVMDLFDIGDDITAAVVWLAEHWSAELPAPAWWTGIADQYRAGRPVLVLQVFCSPAQLAHIAGLAEAAPTLDRTGPRGRRRYVCARPFGTGLVELRACASTEPGQVDAYLASYLAKAAEADR